MFAGQRLIDEEPECFMNWNYVRAGSAGVNGLLLVVAVGLMVGWKVSGWIGLDRWLLPLLGTPWHPGTIFTGRRTPTDRPLRGHRNPII
jgi:hypothetical protein